MRLRFADPILERFYVAGDRLSGVDDGVLDHCLEFLAVLSVVRSIRDLGTLEAFRPFALQADAGYRLALPLNGDWALIFAVDADNTADATATIESLSHEMATRRSG